MPTSSEAYNVKSLGHYLRVQRESWGWTQDEMARRTRLTQKKISRIENGELQDPGFADVMRIAWELGVEASHVARMAGLNARARERVA